MDRVLLVIPSATYRASGFLTAAKRLDLDVVTASDREQVLAETMGDRFLRLDLADPGGAGDKVVRLARRLPLDAVFAVDDQGALVAASAAATLGLRHNPVSAIAATRDKLVMRRLFAAANIAQPAFHPVARKDEAAIVEAAGIIGYPAVVKPVSLSASRGVIRVDDDGQAVDAARRIDAILDRAGADPDEPVLVEHFVSGPEIAVEGLLSDGAFELLAIFDKPDPLEGPYFEETIYVTPSRHPGEALEAARRLISSGCAALGLVEGPIHAEVRLAGTERTPVVIEVAARTIGGRCAAALGFSSGTMLEEVVLAHAVGRDEIVARRGDVRPGGVMMLPIPASGRLEAVLGVDAALAVRGVTGCEITVTPGRRIEALPEGDRYLGFLFASADSPELAEAALRRGHNELTPVIVDDGGGDRR